MKQYEVEVIHEPTGTYMNFTTESDLSKDEVWNEILHDLSIVAFEEK